MMPWYGWVIVAVVLVLAAYTCWLNYVTSRTIDRINRERRQ